MPNAKLAYAVLDDIDTDPTLWDQRRWLLKETGCGAAGCFFGKAALLSGAQPVGWIRAEEYGGAITGIVVYDDREWTVNDLVTRELLDISWIDSDALSHPNNSREDLGRLVLEIFGPRPEENA